MNRQLLRTGETKQMGPRGEPMAEVEIPAYWTAMQVAQLLAVKASTLRTWMRRGQSPPYLKIGDTVRFDPRTVTSWLDAKTITGHGSRDNSPATKETRHSPTAPQHEGAEAERGDG